MESESCRIAARENLHPSALSPSVPSYIFKLLDAGCIFPLVPFCTLLFRLLKFGGELSTKGEAISDDTISRIARDTFDVVRGSAELSEDRLQDSAGQNALEVLQDN